MELLIPATVIATLLVTYGIYRSASRKKRTWALFIKPFTETEYPYREPATDKESAGWLLDDSRARVHKAWVTTTDDGVFVWHFWKRKRYRPFKIEWREIAVVVFQRFKTPNSWGSDDWGHAEIAFRDQRSSITVPWREIFEDSVPESVGYKIHPKLYEQDV